MRLDLKPTAEFDARQRAANLNGRAWKLRWRSRNKSMLAAQTVLHFELPPETPGTLYETLRASRTLAWQYKWLGMFDEAEMFCLRAQEMSDRMATSATQGNCDVLCDVHSILGVIRYSRGQHNQASKLVEHALARLAPDARSETRIDLLTTLSTILRYHDEYDAARSLLFEALKISEQSGDLPEFARVTSNISRLYVHQNKHREGYEFAHYAEEAAHRARNHVILPYAIETLGASLIGLGRFEEALLKLAKAETIATQSGDQRAACQILEQQSRAYLGTGQSELALKACRRGGKIARSMDYPIWSRLFLRTQSQILEDLGRAQEALKSYKLFAELDANIYRQNSLKKLSAQSEQLEESERARAELVSSLTHAQRLQAIGQLTGGVAHDFNNLLGVIQGNAELLSREMTPDNSSLTAILAATHRGSELTKALLAFSRKQPLRPTSVDVNAILANLKLFINRTLENTVTTKVGSDPELWHCEADAGRLENALLNLLLNARDAMPDGGVLTIEASNALLDAAYAAKHLDVVPGEYVMISVTDTGAGMKKPILEKAFDPFFTTKPVGQGSGLGLSTVFGFAKQSGGEISIDSKDGHGTTVRLFLPRTLNPVAPPHDIVPVGAPPQEARYIIVVEDDPAMRQLIELSLKWSGYRVRAFCDGPSMLAALLPNEPAHLLVTDVMLPCSMNGAEVAIAATKLYPDIEVLYISGYSKDAIMHEGKLDDGVDLLSKPFSLKALIDRVQYHLHRYEARLKRA
jgi:signal transduction histidine kinase/ActR/RegA family two-component response regulator